MTDEELQALLDTASPGPWHLINRDAGVRSADMALIANAPALAAEVLALRAGAAASAERIKELEDALREVAGDLEAEIRARAGGDLPRRVERDLEPVFRARALLKEPDQ